MPVIELVSSCCWESSDGACFEGDGVEVGGWNELSPEVLSSCGVVVVFGGG